MELTLQPLRNIIKKAGAKRVSDKAAEELGILMEEKAGQIAKEAQRLSEHAGRRTVMRRDIKMAKKNLER
jgi:DNA-binding protein